MYVLYTLYACCFDLANNKLCHQSPWIQRAATKPRVNCSETLIFFRSHDVFVSLPTGSGKILCYCLLPKAFDFVWQRIGSTQSIVVVVSSRSCPQISEAYVVRRGTSGRDDALKSCLRLPVLRSEATQRMQNTETDAITGHR